SVMEHTYDRVSPLDRERPMAHVNVLRDLVRMLKPGGILLMNWDVYLLGVAHHIGWDFEVDFALLRHCGLNLVTSRRRVHGKEYICHHPYSLFFNRIGLAQYPCLAGLRGVSINMLWRKPGQDARVKFAPDPALEAFYFPDDEVTCAAPMSDTPELTTDQ